MNLSRKTHRSLLAGVLAAGVASSMAPNLASAAVASPATTSVRAAAVAAGGTVIDVDTKNLAEVKAMAKDRPVVILVTAPAWCGYCKKLDPVIRKYNAADAGKWVLAIIDVDKAGGAEKEFGVSGYPTMLPWGKSGEMKSTGRLEGWAGESGTREWVDKVLKDYGPTTTPAPTNTPAPTTTAPRPTQTSSPTSTAPRPTESPRPTDTPRPTETPTPLPTKPRPTQTPTLPAPTDTVPGPAPTTTAPAPTTTAPAPTTTAPAPVPGDGKLPELPPGAVQLTDKNFDEAVIKESAKRTVIIDFSKDKCEPCLAIAPILDEKYRADAGKWQYTRLDGTAFPDLWKRFDNPWFPTLVAMRDGKEISRRTGYEGDAAAVKTWIDAVSDGKAPATDPLVMDLKSEADWNSVVAMSKRHPVALRAHLDGYLSTSKKNGEIAKAMANGDGGKWSLVNADMGGSGNYILARHGIRVTSVPQMFVFYNGKVQLKPLNGPVDEAKMREWVNTMLSTHYPQA